MRCHICDSSLSSPQFNRDHDEWDPCITCLTVIADTCNEHKDQAVWYDEGPLPDENSPKNEDMSLFA